MCLMPGGFCGGDFRALWRFQGTGLLHGGTPLFFSSQLRPLQRHDCQNLAHSAYSLS